jgi:hypothetical protein
VARSEEHREVQCCTICDMSGPQTDQDVESEIDRLVGEYRVTCLWFAPPDYFPRTDAQRLRALDYIEKYGDREAFKRARTLRQWLLHSSKRP